MGTRGVVLGWFCWLCTWEDLFPSSPSTCSCLWCFRFQFGTIHWLIIMSLWLFSLNEQELIQFGFNLWELLGSLFNWCTPWFWWRSYTKHVVPKKVRVTNGYALAASSTMSMHLYARVIYVIKLLICDICHAQTQSSSSGTCTQIIHIVYIHHLNINIYIHIYTWNIYICKCNIHDISISTSYNMICKDIYPFVNALNLKLKANASSKYMLLFGRLFTLGSL